MQKRKKRTFDDAFKAAAVKQVAVPGKSPAQVARELDLVPSVLASWLKAAGAEGGAPGEGALKAAEREELAKLRKDKRIWDMERAFLKKAAAFFAKETA